MADTNTTNLNLIKPEIGGAEDTWGVSINSDLDALDAIFSATGTEIDVRFNSANFDDNKKAVFGTGDDLQIYHDGTNSYIQDAGTGTLRIRSDEVRIYNATGNKIGAQFIQDGEARLKFDNSTKLATKTTGIDVTGVITTDGLTTSADINFGDNDKAVFGAGSDLQIYHDGSNSFINETGTGNLYIQGAGTIRLRGTTTEENLIEAVENGAVSLYHNNSVKLATTSTGVDVTGALAVSSTAPTITIEDSDSTSTFNKTEIQNSGGTLNFNTRQSDGTFVSTDYQMAKDANGVTDHKFFIAGSEKIRIDSSGNLLVGGTTSPDTNGITIETTASSGGLNILSPTTGRGDIFFGDSGDKNIGQIRYAHSDNSMTFRTNASDRVTINSSGNVGIGVTSPDKKLHVQGSTASGMSADANTLLRLDNNANNSIQINSGTSSLGQIRFGDADSNYRGAVNYSHSDNNLNFVTQGSERMRIDSSGNFGIGTSSPSSLLHLGGSTNKGVEITSSTANAGYLAVFQDQAIFSINRDGSDGSFADTAKAAAVIKLNSAAADSNIEFQTTTTNNASPTTRLTIDKNGNVGIGASSPSQKLSVDGNVQIMGNGTDNDSHVLMFNNGACAIARDANDLELHAYNAMVFGVSNTSYPSSTERMRIDSSGQVGIGTSSPQGNLHVEGAAGASGGGIIYVTDADNGSTASDALHISKSGDTAFVYNRESSGDLQLGAGNTAGHVVIKSSGNVGIGSSSPSSLLHLESASSPTLQIKDTTNNATFKAYAQNSNTHLANTSNHDLIIDTNNTERIRILAGGNVGIGYSAPTEKLFVKQGSVNQTIARFTGANNDRGLVIGTAISGSTNDSIITYDAVSTNSVGQHAFKTDGTERVRIDSSGRLLVGTTSANGVDGVTLNNGGYIYSHRSGGVSGYFDRSTSDGDIVEFRKDSSKVGSISVTGSATAYNTSSDARLKDVTGTARGLEVINELNPVAYNWKADGKADEGLIAQEVKELVPNAVVGSEADMYSMDYSKLVVHLVAGMQEQQKQMQEQQAIIEDLQTQLNKLKR